MAPKGAAILNKWAEDHVDYKAFNTITNQPIPMHPGYMFASVPGVRIIHKDDLPSYLEVKTDEFEGTVPI